MGGKGGKGPGVGGRREGGRGVCCSLVMFSAYTRSSVSCTSPPHQQPSIIESLMHPTWWCPSDYKMETK